MGEESIKRQHYESDTNYNYYPIFLITGDNCERPIPEMRMEYKTKRKHSPIMTCVALEKEPLTIDISEYNLGFQKEL